MHEPWMDNEDYIKATIKRAESGESESALEALRLCQAGLLKGNLSNDLGAYLAKKLDALDKALSENDALRKLKSSSGSSRSDRLAAIELALGISKPTGRPTSPFPDWQTPYAAIGTHLRRSGIPAELINSSLDLIRRSATAGENGLDRSQASRILKAHTPLMNIDRGDLHEMARPLFSAIQSTMLEKQVAEKIADLFSADS